MNDKLIKRLKEERDQLYPNGFPIQGRGCSKTYTYLRHQLRWNAYELYCQMLEYLNYEDDMDSAHKWINDFVVAQMPD
ncbi:hypothetical protein [Clostridium sp. HBUAS56010]|uniref:hypothetical protein n=1 Tax=Clostridium sp. HBUAS56010 TaxID=2571127 RepID=UPI0011781606|nr:hypothetical protein [Clostridium sp. HBUAS56010]